MTDPLQLARECGGIRSGTFDAVKTWEFTEAGLSTLIDRVRAEAMREQREKDAAICAHLWTRAGTADECADAIISEQGAST